MDTKQPDWLDNILWGLPFRLRPRPIFTEEGQQRYRQYVLNWAAGRIRAGMEREFAARQQQLAANLDPTVAFYEWERAHIVPYHPNPGEAIAELLRIIAAERQETDRQARLDEHRILAALDEEGRKQRYLELHHEGEG